MAELTNSISFGLVGQENVAAAVSAIIAVFGATAQALDQAGKPCVVS